MTPLRRRSRFVLGAAMVAASVAVLSACGSSGSGTSNSAAAAATTSASGPLGTLISAARTEGSVTWYTGLAPEQDTAAANAFTKAYGIKVNVLREATGSLDQRYSSEAQAGSPAADVILQSDPTFVQTATTKGWIRALTPDVVPSVADFPTEDVKGAAAQVLLVPWGIEYNTSAVTGQPPTNYTDLLNPKYDGKILITDPRGSAGIAGNVYYLSTAFGSDFLSKLGRLHPQVINSEVPGLQQIAAGGQTVLIGATDGADGDLVQSGAPLKYVTPDNTSGFAQYLSVSAKSPHPNAARLFANFLLTKDGNQPLAAGDAISPLGNLPGAVPKPGTFVVPDLTKAQAAVPDMVQQLGLS